jgi:DNA-binding transcriptional ArsR family regulator
MLQTLTALAEPNRFRIVELLRDGPRPVNDIAERLALTQPQASKHLRVLKESGVVVVRPVAQQRLYEVNAAQMRALYAWVERYRVLWDARFTEMDALLEEMQANEEKSHDRE